MCVSTEVSSYADLTMTKLLAFFLLSLAVLLFLPFRWFIGCVAVLLAIGLLRRWLNPPSTQEESDSSGFGIEEADPNYIPAADLPGLGAAFLRGSMQNQRVRVDVDQVLH